MTYNYEAQFERNERRRFAAEARAYDKVGRQIDAADALIGELRREGCTVFYINVRSKDGRLTGATREFSHRWHASSYLIRNRYV